MANQESHYQRVKNALTPFLLVWKDYDRNNKIAQAEIDLNEKLNQLGYIDGQDITGLFIRLLRMPQSLDPEERFRPLSDRLDIDFTRLLREFFNSPEYRQAQRALEQRWAARDAELAAAAAAAAAPPPQRARKNRKTRVRSRKMRKTRKNSSR